jgi:hypothetical protein
MKNAIRIIVLLITVPASFYFINFIPFSLLPSLRQTPIPIIVSLLSAIGIGILIWKKSGNVSNSLALHIVIGGIILGAIGFILGFIGPIIFNWGGNQGPMLGIFITGPIGFLIGLIWGGIYWYVKKKKIRDI